MRDEIWCDDEMANDGGFFDCVSVERCEGMCVLLTLLCELVSSIITQDFCLAIHTYFVNIYRSSHGHVE